MMKISFINKVHITPHGHIKLVWLCEYYVYNHKLNNAKAHSLDLVKWHSTLYIHLNKLSLPPKNTCPCHLLQWPLTLDICEKLTGNNQGTCDPWREQICFMGHTSTLQLGHSYLRSSSLFQHYSHSFQVIFPKS